MGYFNPALLSKYGHTVTVFGKNKTVINEGLCELVSAIRKFDQTHPDSRRSSEAERRVHTPQDAGSSPAAATTPKS